MVDDLLYGDFVDEVNTLNGWDAEENDDRLIWIRNRMSSQGHRLSPDRHTAYCGFTLAVDEYWYEETFRPWMLKWFEKDTGDFFIAIDKRKGGKCAGCKPKNAYPDARYVDEEPVPQEVPAPARFIPESPTEIAAQARFMSKVAWVAQELGATIEDHRS